MHTGTTSVRKRASRKEFRSPAIFVRVGLAAALACAPVTGALAQGMQRSSGNNNQERQTAGKRQPTPGRLLVPLTGTLQTAAPPTQAVEGHTPPTDVPTPTALEDTPVPTVTGTFSVQRFAPTTDGRVAAVGTMTLSFLEPESNVARTVITQGAMPLAAVADTATPGEQPQARQPAVAQDCETLSLMLGRVDVDLPGRPLQLADVNLEFVQGFDPVQAGLLCEASSLIGQAAPPSELVRTLNAFLDTIG